MRLEYYSSILKWNKLTSGGFIRIQEKCRTRLSNNSGVFTIEAIIIFWAIFMMILIAFSQIGWEYQKAHTAQVLHRELSAEDKTAERIVETRFTVLGTDDEIGERLYRRWDKVDLNVRLFWIRTATEIMKQVSEDEQ